MALDPSTSIDVAVGVASAQFGITLSEGVQYQIASTTNSWIAVGANPTAAAHTNGSSYLPANFPILLTATKGNTKIAIIQDAAGGFASIAVYV